MMTAGNQVPQCMEPCPILKQKLAIKEMEKIPDNSNNSRQQSHFTPKE